MQPCTRFAASPAFSMAHAAMLAHDLLDRPDGHGEEWAATPWELRAATADERCAHLDARGASPVWLLCDVQPLVVAWRAGGFDDAGDALHVWHMDVAEAAQRGMSEKELGWATAEAIIHLRVLTIRLPRAAALQVGLFALNGQILRPVEHAQLPSRYVRTMLH